MSLMSAFGRKPTHVTPKNYWGARAIFTNGIIDIPYDRKSFVGDPETAEDFLNWVNKEFFPKLKENKDFLYEDPRTAIEYDSTDGRFHGEASCQESGGYLYIGCWEVRQNDNSNT